MTLKTADGFMRSKRWLDASVLFHRAIFLDPGNDQNYFAMADGLQRQAVETQDASVRAKLIEEAVHMARQAQHINPLKAEHMANLGRLYLWWASITREPVQRRVRGDLADYYFGRALRLSPNQVQLWCQRAMVNYSILGRTGPVLGYLNRAVEVDPQYPLTYQMLGDHFARVGWGEKDSDRRFEMFSRATTYYEEAFERARREQLGKVYEMRIATGEIYEQLGDLRSALRHAREALAIAPRGDEDGLRALIETLREQTDTMDE